MTSRKQGVDIHEAIRSRRSIFDFKPDPVPTELLEKALGFSVWAPNHLLTEPWRFTLLGEQSRRLFAEKYGEVQVRKAPPGADDSLRALLRKSGVEKFLAKPTVVVVSCLQQGEEQRRREDYAATCCAVQNVFLAAWADGIGMQWSTNALTMEPWTYEYLGIDPDQEYIMGFLYVGYPAEIPTRDRKPIGEVLRRMP
jgi:nitroreductase